MPRIGFAPTSTEREQLSFGADKVNGANIENKRNPFTFIVKPFQVLTLLFCQIVFSNRSQCV